LVHYKYSIEELRVAWLEIRLGTSHIIEQVNAVGASEKNGKYFDLSIEDLSFTNGKFKQISKRSDITCSFESVAVESFTLISSDPMEMDWSGLSGVIDSYSYDDKNSNHLLQAQRLLHAKRAHLYWSA